MNSKTKYKILILIFIILTILFLVFTWLKPNSSKGELNSSNAIKLNDETGENSLSEQNLINENIDFVSKSQHDIQINCQIQADQSNRLIVNENTKNCYEFFISQHGEKEISQIKSDFIQFAKNTFKQPLLSQLTDLWARYIQYRENLGHLTAPNQHNESAQYYIAIFNQIKSLRKQFFSDYEIEGLFGKEDEYHDYTLARMSVMEDKNLSGKEKAEKLQNLLNDLPEDLQENLRQMSLLQDLTKLTAEIKTKGGSAEDIRQMRLNLVGPEATQRLEHLDTQRSNWKTKVTDYLSERDHIIKSNMNTQDKQLMIQKLRLQHFSSSQEQRRIETYEKVQDQGGKLPFADE